MSCAAWAAAGSAGRVNETLDRQLACSELGQPSEPGRLTPGWAASQPGASLAWTEEAPRLGSWAASAAAACVQGTCRQGRSHPRARRVTAAAAPRCFPGASWSTAPFACARTEEGKQEREEHVQLQPKNTPSILRPCLVPNLGVVKLAFCHKCATVAFRLYL
ncbi:hypothetical protein SEVIR_8G232800v4 [Setaria viridis]|uniref:Uncharacterized protein n=1 Tax=Setaria viridis TaxID=4556 RepID=A0A4U6TWU3_SETVI|nr:hypothetical protein SEVIR_8G232800v2 [Setaria viridis]